MSISSAERRARFRKLHDGGCFVLPNPWDAGSARLLQHLGFKALATTSSGFAWTTGRADYAVTRDEALSHVALLCGAVDVPVNADFESGFASHPEDVAANVTLALETGIAGLSIEDRKQDGNGLYDKAFAAARIKAARAAADNWGQDVILVARTEGLLSDPGALHVAIDKLTAFAEAGADCLYAPGLRKKAHIADVVKAVAPKPVNVLAVDPEWSIQELADLGVRRISLGSALARIALGAVISACTKINAGSFEAIADAASYGTINGMFESLKG